MATAAEQETGKIASAATDRLPTALPQAACAHMRMRRKERTPCGSISACPFLFNTWRTSQSSHAKPGCRSEECPCTRPENPPRELFPPSTEPPVVPMPPSSGPSNTPSYWSSLCSISICAIWLPGPAPLPPTPIWLWLILANSRRNTRSLSCSSKQRWASAHSASEPCSSN